MTASSKWRAALAATAASAVLAAAPLVGAQSALAQPYPPPAPPNIGVDDPTPDAGGTLGISATGFEPGQEVEVSLFSYQVVLGYFTADENGTVMGTVTIPASIDPGQHMLQLETTEEPMITLTRMIVVDPESSETPGPTPPEETPPPTPPGQTHTPTPPGHTHTPTPPGHTHTPTPPGHTHTPTPPGHHDNPGHDDDRPGDPGAGDHQNQHGDQHLANTGEDRSSIVLGGVAAALVLAGGALMAVRRLKRH
ncbi:LPXTG cell wall anchor domain-containing protein [Streptomyces sp. NPDC001530]|uniref:LPXTG cell wall anchor domain-containing protein n=1 Tax=Streptomyces sp. NPDC001530 TaxID=3364582 RepID=UPI0036971D4B